jgi:ribosomal protein L14E/L6E/L27E
MMSWFKEGQIVESLRGHDRGECSVVLRCEGDRVLIANGKRHKLAGPKRKNYKHLRCSGPVIPLENLTDQKLRTILGAKGHNTQEGGQSGG